MQQADSAHSATKAHAPSSNIITFPSSRRPSRRSWPSATSRRTPEMVIALATCAVLTPEQRGRVRELVALDCDVFNDGAARQAVEAVRALA